MKKTSISALFFAAVLCLSLCSACQRTAPPPDASVPPPDISVPDSAISVPDPFSTPQPAPPAGSQPVSEPTPGPDPIPEPEPDASRNTKLYILMYHHFVPEGVECNTWMLTDTRFREDLQWLADHGYTTVLPSQLIAGTPLPERAVMLTLDDGYASNYQLAYPLLQEFQAKAVISLITHYTQDGHPSFLTWDMCSEMAQSGLVELGSHTHACHDNEEHGIKRWKGETQTAYEARVLPDLQTSIDLISEHVGVSPQFFAYPNGKVESWAKDFIQEHFAVTVTTRHGAADLANGLYSLPRCNVSMGVPLDKILPS